MDVKYILSSVAKESVKLGASGNLVAGVRLTGAVNGERGEGYWLLYEDNLVLLYRRLGERDYEGCCGDLPEWKFADYREEKYALMLQVSCVGTNYLLEFTPAERNSAEIILNSLVQAHAAPEMVYSEEMLVMAGLLSFLSSDGHEDYAVNILGKELWRAGRKYAAGHSLPDLVALGGKVFNTEQKECVLANLIEQRMSDDLWKSEEAAALRELAEVWGLARDYFDTCAGILLKRRNLGVLFQK